jgi:phosphoglycolate phosphatase/pyrophosphatase PpaX
METVQEFKGSNGIAAVVSHSESKKIEKEYLAHCGFKPGAVFGRELPEDQRKPNPYPVQQILIRFNLVKEEVLVVDDLGPDLECSAMWCRIRICSMVSYHTGN